jgi:pimeloyl-ACP methyl ester carboxylesterase
MASLGDQSDNGLATVDVEDATISVEIEAGSFPVIDYGVGEVVLLLHGLPDSRHLWRYQVPALADAGFRVIAPDLRGFGDAPRPESVDAYKYEHSVRDVIEILDAMEIDSVRLVGHDWGMAVAWRVAINHPDVVDRLVALSVGAPGNPKASTIHQREKSWYIDFFQKEGVAEAWLKHDDWKLFREWTREDGDFETYISHLSRPGALTAALNIYRANNMSVTKPPAETESYSPRVSVPTLGVWSDGDHYLTEGHLTGSGAVVDALWEYESISDASHWLMLDKPSELNELLIEFFSRTDIES